MERLNRPTTLAQLQAFIDGDTALSAIRQAMADATDDTSHDLNHALRVAVATLDIADERVAPRDAVAAALLHDVVHVPKSSPLRAQAGAGNCSTTRRSWTRRGMKRSRR